MSITDKLRQYHKKNAELILKYTDDLLNKMEQGEKPEIKVVIRLPRGEAITTIKRKTFKPLAKDFPNIYQWLTGKECEISQYDIQAIKQDSEYKLASDRRARQTYALVNFRAIRARFWGWKAI